MFHYVYRLESQKDKKFYTGVTSDLKRRLKQHCAGKNKSTSYRRPLRLVFYEAYFLKADAMARERYLKTSMGRRVLKKQLSNFLKERKFDKITLGYKDTQKGAAWLVRLARLNMSG